MRKETPEKRFSLKDHLFNRDRVRYLADLFHEADSGFSATDFSRKATAPFKKLELKQRIVHIAETLEAFLPKDFAKASDLIIKALPPPLDPTQTDDDFGEYILAPLGEYVVRNGIKKKHVRRSLKTLKEITKRFSMEHAIRKFVDAHTDVTMKELGKWSRDKNYHVRRLVSEGTRPLLPWSGRLSIDLIDPLPFLDQLHADPTRYVTRSVANHLNDIAKTHPKLVVDRLRQWKKLGQQRNDELLWMSKHALRTLVKQGDKRALRFLGYRANPKILVTDFRIDTPKVKGGEALKFSFTINAERKEMLMVDYVIDFVKSDGSRSPKVFKLKQLELGKGKKAQLKKQHRLLANATTYKLYPGNHRVVPQINGKQFDGDEFEVS